MNAKNPLMAIAVVSCTAFGSSAYAGQDMKVMAGLRVSLQTRSREESVMIVVVALLAVAEPAPLGLVPFSSPESIARLERSKAKADFFVFANQFEGQVHGGMRGPATATVVLNALRADDTKIEKPRDTSHIPAEYVPLIPKQFDPFFKRYTQDTFVDDARFQKVKTRDTFYGKPAVPGQKPDPGIQLRQLGDVLVNYGLDVQVRVVDDALTGDREKTAKAEIAANLAHAGDFVIVNYTRKALGQNGGGHISPLAAYDEAGDSFLVLDVNPNDGKRWSWVPASALFAAMRTKDTIENRGYLLVHEGAAAKGAP